MLSARGQKNADQLAIPWRFARGSTYHPVNNPDGIISFATAENALMQRELEDFANKVQIPGDAFRYAYCTGGGARLPAAFAAHINEYFNPHDQVKAEDIRITSAATALHEILAYSLCAPGEGILTSKPYYGRFELDFGNKAGVQLVGADTDHETCFDEDVIASIENQIDESDAQGVAIRAILIVNPHNPLGRCYPESTLFALLRLCAKRSIHLISDEIYALSTWTNPTFPNAKLFTSLLSIDSSKIIDQDLIHVTYGLSKDFGSAGLKIGALVSKNANLKNAVQALLRFHGVSGPAVAIATAMLEDRKWCRDFVALSRDRIAEAYGHAISHLHRLSIPYYEGGNAGFFLWINLSKFLRQTHEGQSDFDRECELAQRLVDAGVFLHPGEEHSIRRGWFRMIFTMERELVEEGFRRIEKVLMG